ncbi:MAG: hypothetical protein Q9221_002125 [Calogaya cf. arnoldii]
MVITVLLLVLVGIIHGAVISKPSTISSAPEENLSSGGSPLNNGSDNTLKQPPRNNFPWHVHGSPLTLIFSSYGRSVKEDDVISCDVQAKRYIHDAVQTHSDGPIPPNLQLHWAYKSALLSIQHSPRMTYGNLTDIFTGIETFQLTYSYFELHFEIFDTANGIIGTGDIRNIRSSELPSLTTSNLPTNNISPSLIPPTVSKQLPEPPFTWPPKDARIKLTFTAFGPEISDKDILTCYVSAANYALQMIKARGDIPIPAGMLLHWAHGRASLTIQHMPLLRFGDLAEVLAALGSFQSQYGAAEAAFHFSNDKDEILGAGSVASRPNVLRPPDLTTSLIPNSPLSLIFGHYGGLLPGEDVLNAFLLLTQRIVTALLNGKRDELMLEALDVKSHRVFMAVNPEEQMTWGQLAVALEVITEFVSRWGGLQCFFVVAEEGKGRIGNGFVMFV